MEGFRLTVTGSSEEMDMLELFCRQYGVLTERGVVSAYEGVAVTMFAVYITARIDILCQCISASRGAQEAPLKVSCFVAGKGTLAVEDFGPEAVANLLRATDQLHVENAWA